MAACNLSGGELHLWSRTCGRVSQPSRRLNKLTSVSGRSERRCSSTFRAWVWATGGRWSGWRERRRWPHRPPRSPALWGKCPAGPGGWRGRSCSSAGPAAAAGCCTAPPPAGGAVSSPTPTPWAERARTGRRRGRGTRSFWALWTAPRGPWGGGARTGHASGWGWGWRGSTWRGQTVRNKGQNNLRPEGKTTCFNLWTIHTIRIISAGGFLNLFWSTLSFTWTTSDSICSGPGWRRRLIFQPTGCCRRRSTWLCSGGWGSGRASGRRPRGGWPAWPPPAPPPSFPAAALPQTQTRVSHTCARRCSGRRFAHTFVSDSGELPAAWWFYGGQPRPRPSAACSQSACRRTEPLWKRRNLDLSIQAKGKSTEETLIILDN